VTLHVNKQKISLEVNVSLMTSLIFASLAGSSGITCPIPVPTEAEVPWIASPRREDYSWMSRFEWCERFQKNLAEPSREDAELVFLGDSITQGWTEVAPDVWSQAFGALKPLRLGIGGDRTQQLLWRMDQGELTGLNPRVLVLLIGINNVNAGDSQEAILQGIEAVLERIHQYLPRTHILVLGLLPSGEAPDDPLRKRIQSLNEKLAKLQREQLTYADIGSVFLHPDGRLNTDLMPDFLHPGAQGYRVFAQALAPHLGTLFGADVVDVGAIE
jgi:lysophospholipase L1-like esterase